MGIRPQLTSRDGAGRRTRRGAALPAALFGLVTVTLLASAIFAASRLQGSASRNRESSSRALQLAEDGLAHAVTVVRDSMKHRSFTQVLRGHDNSSTANADDGRLVGHGLSTNIDIPAAGRTFGSGSYTVQITDDNDGDGNLRADVNLRVRMRCIATTSDGATATLDAVIGVQAFPAIAANGDISMAGGAQVRGLCGGVHANEDLLLSGGNVTVAGGLTASSTVSGTARDTLGASKSPVGGKPQVEIPTVGYADFCGTATTNATVNKSDVDFWLAADGRFYFKGVPGGTPAVTPAIVAGWRRTSTAPFTWTIATPAAVLPGKYCIEGNVDIASNMGSAVTPLRMTVISTGSVRITGNPYIIPATNDSVLVVAGGDVAIAGNPTGAANSYEGLIYANAQCQVSGNPRVAGQLMCRNQPTGAGNQEWAPINSISGNAILSYGCGGIFSRRRIYSWLQKVD